MTYCIVVCAIQSKDNQTIVFTISNKQTIVFTKKKKKKKKKKNNNNRQAILTRIIVEHKKVGAIHTGNFLLLWTSKVTTLE